MKKIKYTFFFIIFCIISTSCDETGRFFNSSSVLSEVLVVMDDNDWKDSTGVALSNILISPVNGLPQKEPNFKIIRVSNNNFSESFKSIGSIIIPIISSQYTKASLSSEIDKYVSGQFILSIKAPDKDSFIEFVNNNKDVIINYILEQQLKKYAILLEGQQIGGNSKIKELFGIKMAIPPGLSNVSIGDNFYWATNNSSTRRKDIVVYSIPYTSETIFEKDSLIAIRNKILGEQIKGSFNSKMTTVLKYAPEYKKMTFNSNFTAQIKGLWEMTTDNMGGPFVSRAFVNKNTNRVIFVDAFVYSPQTEKRNLIRELEAVFYTISVLDKNEKK